MDVVQYNNLMDRIQMIIYERVHKTGIEPNIIFINDIVVSRLIDYLRETFYIPSGTTFNSEGILKVFGIRICRSCDLGTEEIYAS